MSTRRTLIVLAIILALVAAGCGKKNEVGKGLHTNDNGGGSGAFGLSTTTTAAATATTALTATTAKPVATTAKPTTTTVEQPAFTITIRGDSFEPKFDPNQAACPHAHICRWQNSDVKPRSVVADDGSFASPMIPPGGVWDYRPPTASGHHNYHDGTRPYAGGEITFG